MLTQDQLQKIENLCKSEGVHYYDIRHEMIDHIAEGVEEKMKQSPEAGFDKSLKEMACNLGVFGFKKVAEDREKAAISNLKRKSWKLFLEYLTFPKIIASCILWLALASPKIFFATSAIYNIRLLAICLLLVFIAGLIYSVKFEEPIEKLLALPRKIMYFWGFAPFQLLNVSIFLVNYKNEAWFNTDWFVLLYAAFAVCAFLFVLAWFHTYNVQYNIIRKRYPLAFKN